jgi:sugar phosphate isomerase/epimerase
MVTLSASTLGAPGESLQQVLSWLQQASFAGIELRLSVNEIADPTLTRAARRAIRTEIEDAGVMVTGIASYVKVGSSVEDEMILGSLVGALDFAADLGAPVVRVFLGAPVEPGPYDRVPQLLQPREERAAKRAQRRRLLRRGLRRAAGSRDP